jgi:RimJ/RimL family protein N-acetyltransferase
MVPFRRSVKMRAMADIRFCVEHPSPAGLLRAVEPTSAEVQAAASQLAEYYNDAHNSAMMAHEERMSREDVIAFFEEAAAREGRCFFLYLDDVLVGDADFRDIDSGCAEFAIMIGDRSLQGKGLGKKFAIMLHELAFGELGLDRIYATFVPANFVSMSMFEKLGYERDDSPTSRSFTDDESDISMSVDRSAFDPTSKALVDLMHVSTRNGGR